MANILITADSTFEPFSFERYIKPYEIYTEAYKEAENELEDLSTKSETIREYINRDPYSKSASIYNAYTKQLDDEVSRLSSEGLKGTRGRLLQLKRNYNKSIEPIIKKVEHKQKLAAEQREANLKANGALRFDVDYNSNSLDNVDVNKTYSAINLDKITEDTAKQVITAAKSVINKPEYASAFGNQYIERRLQMGYSMDDILNEIGNLPGAPEELKNIRKNILNKLNLDNFDNKTISEVNSAISNGMMYGVGEIKYESLANRNFTPQHQKDALDLQERALNLKTTPIVIQDTDGVSVALTLSGNTLTAMKHGKPVPIKDEWRKYFAKLSADNSSSSDTNAQNLLEKQLKLKKLTSIFGDNLESSAIIEYGDKKKKDYVAYDSEGKRVYRKDAGDDSDYTQLVDLETEESVRTLGKDMIDYLKTARAKVAKDAGVKEYEIIVKGNSEGYYKFFYNKSGVLSNSETMADNAAADSVGEALPEVLW